MAWKENGITPFGAIMEWISVNEVLPEQGADILKFWQDVFHYRDENIVVIFYDNLWACVLANRDKKVTHWIALPQPPGELWNQPLE